ncbi:MAG TPA: hypothetical protein VI411_11760 [Actinomycetota bacterium]
MREFLPAAPYEREGLIRRLTLQQVADRAGVDKAYVLHLIEAGTSTNVEMRALELGLNWTPGPA